MFLKLYCSKLFTTVNSCEAFLGNQLFETGVVIQHFRDCLWTYKLIALKMKAVCSFKILVPIYKSTWCLIPEEHHGHIHHCKNLKSHKSLVCCCQEIFLPIYSVNVHICSVLIFNQWTPRIYLISCTAPPD